MSIEEEYFEWMYQLVEGRKFRTLLTIIHDTDFYSIMPLDDNRLIDGIGTRTKFALDIGIPVSVMNKKMSADKCSVLEMMIGLALRVEDTIMSDTDFGDRTSMWFWMMIKSLGLYEMTDDRIVPGDVRIILETLLERKYKPSGEGGLFTVLDKDKDMREIEIWYQMCLFFDKLL